MASWGGDWKRLAGGRQVPIPRAQRHDVRSEGGKRLAGGRQVPIPGGLAFVPDPLPPRITYTGEVDDEDLGRRVERAMMALGRLNMAGELVGGGPAGLGPHIAREAVDSSRIEGVGATLGGLLRRRALPGEARGEIQEADAREAENNARALGESMAMVDGGAPIDLCLIRRAHRALFAGLPKYAGFVEPGEIRTVQNWIGGRSVAEASYVPPPPDMVPSLMENLVAYIEAGRGPASAVARCAIAHCQFESIHPFPDGNGRVGRILILLMMRKYRLLSAPAMNISAYLLTHRPSYYDMLRASREPGGWARWIAFFADACAEQAEKGATAMRGLDTLQEGYRRRMEATTRSPGAVRVLGRLAANPYITISGVQGATGLKHAGSLYLVNRLVEAGILEAVPAASRASLYVAPEMLRMVSRAEENEG